MLSLGSVSFIFVIFGTTTISIAVAYVIAPSTFFLVPYREFFFNTTPS